MRQAQKEMIKVAMIANYAAQKLDDSTCTDSCVVALLSVRVKLIYIHNNYKFNRHSCIKAASDTLPLLHQNAG